jgi:hypothetical protein
MRLSALIIQAAIDTALLINSSLFGELSPMRAGEIDKACAGSESFGIPRRIPI